MPDAAENGPLQGDDKQQQGSKKRRSLFSVLFSGKQQAQSQQKITNKETSSMTRSSKISSALEDAEEDPDSYELDLSESIQAEKNREREEEELKELLLKKGSDFQPLLATVRSMYSESCSPSISSSSEPEFNFDFNCESPALVVDCSDDTSCSSVELIWSRPRIIEPKRQQQLATTAASPASTILSSNHTESHQKLSVLELAKPIRAKNRSTTPSKIPSKSSSQSPATHSTNDVHWVANPLFSSEEEIKYCEVCDCDKLSVQQETEQPLRDIVDVEEDCAGTECGATDTPDDETVGLRKRWSLRGKSPFNITRDNIYLNQIMNNLDAKKIRSNVSSIKSQLVTRMNNTGKRASILADQLISSIRDTTTKSQSDDESALHRNSFATNTSSFDTTTRKQFSLIYLHQQQANGQQVITRQPQPMHTNPTTTSTRNISPAPIVTAHSTIEAKSEGTAERDSLLTIEATVKKDPFKKRRKRLRHRRSSRKVIHTDDSEGSDEEKFCEEEFEKFSKRFSTGRQRTRLRSLNYWRRFRIKNQTIKK